MYILTTNIFILAGFLTCTAPAAFGATERLAGDTCPIGLYWETSLHSWRRSRWCT